MIKTRTRRLAPGVLLGASALAVVPLLAACTDNSASSSTPGASADPRALSVTATDTACTVSAGSAPSGTLRFAVTNNGSKVNEFYLLGEDGLRIAGEIENVGPGLSRDLVLVAPAGKYFTACKPGMIGDGIRAAFTVTDSGESLGPTGDDKALVDQANKNYAAYVKDQAEQLLAGTEAFVAAYKAGNDDEARALYAKTRMHWERIEPVAESFGDLDPKTDLREADLEKGQKWTGWHRIEKDLWPARAKGYKQLTTAERAELCRRSAGEHPDAVRQDPHRRPSPPTRSRTARAGLLDEVAKSKVTGEEEYWSRTDLYDFQANIDGARVAFEGLKPLLREEESRACHPDRPRSSRHCRSCSTTTKKRRRLRVLRRPHPRPGETARPTPSTR